GEPPLHPAKPSVAASVGTPAHRIEIDAPSVIAHRECQASPRRKESHPEIMGMGVTQHVIDCLLGDAKTGGLGVGIKLVWRLRRIEMRRDTTDAGLPIEMRAQRRRQAKIIELRRTQ